MRCGKRTTISYTFVFRISDPEYNAPNPAAAMQGRAMEDVRKDLAGVDFTVTAFYLGDRGGRPDTVIIEAVLKDMEPDMEETALTSAARDLLSILDGDFALEKDWALNYLKAVDDLRLALDSSRACCHDCC